MAEIILVQVADGRQMIKRDIFSVIRIKISLDMCTFLAWMLCSDQFKRRICDPLKLKDQNIASLTAEKRKQICFFTLMLCFKNWIINRKG